MNIRKYVFNIVDKLQSNSINKHIKSIESKMNNYNQKNKEHDTRQILNHATNTTRFYEPYKNKNFKDYPIINKELLKNKYNDFLSNQFEKEDLIKVTTSGSYGTPFTYLLTKEKRKRQQAEVIYFGRAANYEVGTKHVFVRVKGSNSKVKSFMVNQLLINPTNMDNSWFEKYRVKLKRGYKVLITYPSAMTALAKYCLERGDRAEDFAVGGIITMAEPLLQEQVEVLKELFNCRIVNRYSTEEFGVVANSCDSGNLHINRASFNVEILDREIDEEVAPGEVGRVVITDYYSYGQPLIRYEIGDLAIYQNKCSCGYNGRVLTSVIGREIEVIYDENGDPVSSFALSSVMGKTDKIMQFQFIQETDKVYRILIVPLKGNIDTEVDFLKKEFKKILGNNTNVILEEVEEIFPLKSGKRPYIIQKMDT